MTAKEKRMYQNVEKWRNLSKSERSSILHSVTVKQVANSMAMEGEPVSDRWIKQNRR